MPGCFPSANNRPIPHLCGSGLVPGPCGRPGTAKNPPGGGFLLEEASPASMFIPEAFKPDARLMAKTADEFLRKEVLPEA